MTNDDLLQTSETPAIAPGFVGVRVTLSPATAQRGPLDLVGVFQLPTEQAEAIDENPHRALVVVLASAEGTALATPFRRRIFFPEDVRPNGPLLLGFFRVRLVDARHALPEGQHWVTASLGEHISNVVTFTGPLAPEE